MQIYRNFCVLLFLPVRFMSKLNFDKIKKEKNLERIRDGEQAKKERKMGD